MSADGLDADAAEGAPADGGRFSALYLAIVNWAVATGARDVGKRDCLWERHTREAASLGPLRVRLNPMGRVIEGVPPFSFALTDDDHFPGLVGVVGPADGLLLASPRPGEDEAGLIAHFDAQPEHSGAETGS